MTLPKVVVVDLDGTFWIKHRHHRLSLRPDIKRILNYLLDRDVKLGVASNHGDVQEVEDFFKSHTLTRHGREKTLWSLFGRGDRVIVQPGSKQNHFHTLIGATGLPGQDMLFFDDLIENRDVFMMGVCFYQVPEEGLDWDSFQAGLGHYDWWFDQIEYPDGST